MALSATEIGTLVGASATLTGNPPVLHLAFTELPSQPEPPGSQSLADEQGAFVEAFIGPRRRHSRRPGSGSDRSRLAPQRRFASVSPRAEVADRFAALAPKVQRAWLLTHLRALRSGHIALAQIP